VVMKTCAIANYTGSIDFITKRDMDRTYPVKYPIFFHNFLCIILTPWLFRLLRYHLFSLKLVKSN